MDRWFSRWNSHALRAFPWRVPQLQAAFESWRLRFERLTNLKLKPELKTNRRLRAISLGLFSVLLGVWAYTLCCDEASLEWHKNHFPSLVIWKAGFTAQGFEDVHDPRILAKTLKELPARVESGNRAWEGKTIQGPSWWAIYPADLGQDPLIFCLNCKSTPKAWQPSGEGWDGFDEVMGQAHAQARTYRPEIKPPGKAPVFLDPREIRY